MSTRSSWFVRFLEFWRAIRERLFTRIRGKGTLGQPAVDPMLENLARLLEAECSDRELIQALNGLAGAEGLASVASDTSDWLSWLVEKQQRFANLDGADPAQLLFQWHRTLDFFAWVDPSEEFARLRVPEVLGSGVSGALLKRIATRQARLRDTMSKVGLERIQAPTGSPYRAGLVELSEGPPVPTDTPALHDTVFRLEPGEGGYRLGDRVLVPSLARRYVHER